MDVIDAVETRLDLREYADEPVDAADKRAVLEAGRLASSGRNLQHWRFVLVEADDDLDRLGELSPTGGWVANADFAVVILTDPAYDFHEIDAGRALTSMQLVAWERGVGSGLYTTDAPEVREFLAVPDDLEVTAVVSFGHPRRAVRGRKDRAPLQDLAFGGRYGEPLEL